MAKRTEFTKKDTLDILKIAQDHLRQYVAYSEAMREIGRGMSLSSPYSDTFCKDMLTNAIANLERDEMVKDPRLEKLDYEGYVGKVRRHTMQKNVEPMDKAEHVRLTLEYFEGGRKPIHCAWHIITGQDINVKS